MPSGFVTPITIKEAIDKIDSRTYLLPAIQRKFVWSSDQIEVLFDSIMRNYPINSFMLWEITDSEIKNNFKFYQFLTKYRQFFKEDNPEINTRGYYSDFYAVIDGQQRLTSLYIGLKGSYAYKLPRKWWSDNEENIPTRHLYLNLSNQLPAENERQMTYDFQFLTQAEYKRMTIDENKIWFRVEDILTFNTSGKLDAFIDKNGWIAKDYTKETIRKLYKVVFKETLINYYLEKTQDIDMVLDIFIRTNSGGEPLSFSDLLMSITTAHWKLDARTEIPDVVNKVFEIGNPGFFISKDFVLKTCLVLFNNNIKFQVGNFDQSNVSTFEVHWERIKKCIIEAFVLLSNLGFNDPSLRAKNAVIPIIYYIFHREIENEINNSTKHLNDKKLIRKWLCLSLLKGVFGGQSDNVLARIRKAIQEELADRTKKPCFPFERLKEEFKNDPAKNLSLSIELIDGLLTTQKDAPDCFPILSLIYSHLNFDNSQKYHKDHLHPASYFKRLELQNFNNNAQFDFYTDPKNWNSIANLQLLDGSLNSSKGDIALQDWVSNKKINKRTQLIPEDVSLDVADFRAFIEGRKSLLRNILNELVSSEDSDGAQEPSMVNVLVSQNSKSKFEEILTPLESDRAMEAIKNGHFDFPGGDAFDDWNTIPFGKPSACKEKLLTVIPDKKTAFDVIGLALEHLEKSCQNITKLVLFYVDIQEPDWVSIWKLYKPSFDALEIDVLIRFRHGLNFSVCQICRLRKATTFKIFHDTFSMRDTRTPACSSCASKPQEWMT